MEEVADGSLIEDTQREYKKRKVKANEQNKEMKIKKNKQTNELKK